MSRSDTFTKSVDLIVGIRVADERVSQGLSRLQLAAKIGVTHQQLQKYEKGVNRLTPGRLVLLAKALNKPIIYFFEGVDLDVIETVPTYQRRLCIELIRNFEKIRSVAMQHKINDLTRAAGEL